MDPSNATSSDKSIVPVQYLCNTTSVVFKGETHVEHRYCHYYLACFKERGVLKCKNVPDFDVAAKFFSGSTS